MNGVLLSIFECHHCAGAMVIFAVSFEFDRMISIEYPREIATGCTSAVPNDCVSGVRLLELCTTYRGQAALSQKGYGKQRC